MAKSSCALQAAVTAQLAPALLVSQDLPSTLQAQYATLADSTASPVSHQTPTTALAAWLEPFFQALPALPVALLALLAQAQPPVAANVPLVNITNPLNVPYAPKTAKLAQVKTFALNATKGLL
jgi:hypothetical protein